MEKFLFLCGEKGTDESVRILTEEDTVLAGEDAVIVLSIDGAIPEDGIDILSDGTRVSDIKEIKSIVPLPVIGIIKKQYPGTEVYITPSMNEIDALHEIGVEIIALDATDQSRPDHKSLEAFYNEIRKKYPDQRLMADCSTFEEAVRADRLGFDFIGTTLVGYTPQSKGNHIEQNDFELIRRILSTIKNPLIAEGNIDTPQKARRVIELGAYSVVVGSIITRPQIITRRFVNCIHQEEAE